jgi:urease accessory protein
LQNGKHKYSLLIEQQNPLAFGDFLPFNLNVKNTLWRPWIVLAFLTSILVPQAQAHTGGGYTHSFFHGLAHPVNGLDHLCAMIAVGLWAGQLGGRALWIVPAAFVGALAFGGWLGLQGVSFPLVEQGIFASLIVIGLLVALALRLPLWAGTVLIAFFCTFPLLRSWSRNAGLDDGFILQPRLYGDDCALAWGRPAAGCGVATSRPRFRRALDRRRGELPRGLSYFFLGGEAPSRPVGRCLPLFILSLPRFYGSPSYLPLL